MCTKNFELDFQNSLSNQNNIIDILQKKSQNLLKIIQSILVIKTISKILKITIIFFWVLTKKI